MARIYYISQSGRLRRKDNTVYLEIMEKIDEDGNNDINNIEKIEKEESLDNKFPIKKIPIPVEDIDSIYIYGEVDLNTKLLNFLSQKTGANSHIQLLWILLWDILSTRIFSIWFSNCRTS